MSLLFVCLLPVQDENSAEALKANLTDVVRFSKAVISKNYHVFEDDAYMKSLACICRLIRDITDYMASLINH